MKKRLFSWLLAWNMVLGMFPAGSLAAGAAPAAGWCNFRNSAVNMGITDAATPKSADYTQLKWTAAFSDYVGVPVLAEGDMYVPAGGKLYKLSISDGSQTASADLAAPLVSGTSYISPTYLQTEGLLVVALDNGIVQAFRISDLSTAWIYQDRCDVTMEGAKANAAGLGGQMLTPITYADGKLYGGFWTGETSQANFVCLDAATGGLEWYYTRKGGFYWAGAAVVGDYIVVGTDNGAGTKTADIAAASAHVLSFRKENTGAAAPVSQLELPGMNDQRSSMAYDADSGRVFFTTKNRYLCSAAVDSGTGILSDLKTYQDEDCNTSTSTPVVYGNYVYYGAGSKYFVVADKTTLKTVAKATMLGTPYQCSFLLSTAYEQEGFLYFYGTYNKKPGGLTRLKVPVNGPASENIEVEELYDARNYEQYCGSSPICGADGTIYYKNDSKTIFALAPAQIEVPVISKNLSTDVVKYDPNSAAAPLAVEATAGAGALLAYQWQSRADGQSWRDLAGQTGAAYTPSTAALGVTHYRCVITAEKDGKSASVFSDAARIEVKNLSDNAALNVMVNNNYNATDRSSAQAVFDGGDTISLTGRTDTVSYLWLGTEDFGTIRSVEFLQGVDSKPAFTMKSGANATYDGVVYNGYYKSTKYTLPIVAKAVVAAEDTSVTNTYYIVIEDETALGSYNVAVDGFTADPAGSYDAETGITFTEAGQTVALTPIVQSIGNGEADKSAWSWSSDNTAVATVDEHGVVTSVGGGKANITFACGTLSRNCAVTFTAPVHTTHTYSDGKCCVCGWEKPSAVKVYFTLTKNSEFVKAKDNTTDLWRAEVSVGDEDCDGSLTLNDAFIAAHGTYSSNGKADFVTGMGEFGLEIKKLWGVETGVVGYYLNDTAANGLTDALKSGDRLTAYFMKADYSDLYTYFDKDSVNAVVGQENTFTVKADTWGTAVAPKGAAVTVYERGSDAQVTSLATCVGADGTFSITFPTAGTYTVEVRSRESVCVVPSRCTVTVSAALKPTPQKISATISVVDPRGGYFLSARAYRVDPGTTAAALLLSSGLKVISSEHSEYGFYVESINGIGEFDFGSGSGWMYKVNGKIPDYSAGLYKLTDGDRVEWVYTRDLGADVGGGAPSGSSAGGGTEMAARDRAAAEAVKALIEKVGSVTKDSGEAIRAAREAYDALTEAQKKLVANYGDLAAAEKAYAQLLEEETALAFADVAESDYFYEAVKWAAKQGITGGTSETTFSPHASCTRAQMVTFLWNAAGKPEPAASAISFQDVDENAYYYKALLWAVQNGITAGTSATTFSPDGVCTRGQMAMFLYRNAKSPAVSGSQPFADVDSAAYYSKAVIWAKNEEITAGTGAATFSPDADCTRAQTVTFLFRCLAQ